MYRKDFLKNISFLSALGFNSGNFKPFTSDAGEDIKPPRLNPGDTVGLVAPGSYISAKELETCRQNIEGLGFRLLYSENILNRHGYFSGTDSQRVNDLMDMFSNKDVKGIFCARGGYGCARILPLLDLTEIINNPKILIGYSDVTALLNGIYTRTGLITFHGPLGISTFKDFSKRYLSNLLITPRKSLVLTNEEQDVTKILAIHGGKAIGKLAGGNLATLVSLLGTPFDIDYSGKIIFLEEIGEEPYRIDRMLTQLIQAGKLTDAAGIVMGIFDDCEPRKTEPAFDFSFTLTEVLYDRLYNLGIPVIYGLSFGHIVNKFTLPVGLNAELDVDNQIITLPEPAVV